MTLWWEQVPTTYLHFTWPWCVPPSTVVVGGDLCSVSRWPEQHVLEYTTWDSYTTVLWPLPLAFLAGGAFAADCVVFIATLFVSACGVVIWWVCWWPLQWWLCHFEPPVLFTHLPVLNSIFISLPLYCWHCYHFVHFICITVFCITTMPAFVTNWDASCLFTAGNYDLVRSLCWCLWWSHLLCWLRSIIIRVHTLLAGGVYSACVCDAFICLEQGYMCYGPCAPDGCWGVEVCIGASSEQKYRLTLYLPFTVEVIPYCKFYYLTIQSTSSLEPSLPFSLLCDAMTDVWFILFCVDYGYSVA